MNRLRQAVSAAAVGDIRCESDGTAVGHYVFPPRFLGFQGHFPGYPVLPAIVQILAAVGVAERAADTPLRLLEIAGAKFHVRIGPSQEIRVACRTGPAREAIAAECRIFVGDALAASFRLVCAPTGGQT